MSMEKIRYTVTANLASKDVLPEYLDWLKGGHAQALITAGALSAEISIIDVEEGENPRLEASYLFPSREVLQAYMDGPALLLREDGKTRWMDTGKIVFSRRFAVVAFEL